MTKGFICIILKIMPMAKKIKGFLPDSPSFNLSIDLLWSEELRRVLLMISIL